MRSNANASEVAATGIWLDVWERASAVSPAARGDILLRPHLETEHTDLCIGARDALLLELRGTLFGRQLACTASCPDCGERCEWDCALDSLRVAHDAPLPPKSIELADGEWQVRARPATGADLAAVSDCADEASAVRTLFERCVVEARCGEREVSASALPAEWIDRISAALADADPPAIADISLACPACAHRWDADFDIAAYLWTELDAWASRTLADVHELALRYGWSETEILALTPARRARYLAMAAP